MPVNNPVLPGHVLIRALLRPPTEQLHDDETARIWGYPTATDLDLAKAQHEVFRHHLTTEGVDVVLHDRPIPGAVDACYVCDPAIMTPHGAVILQMGKSLRSSEPSAMARVLNDLEIDIAGQITGAGTVEGGDCLWLDATTLAVGETFRTNAEGIEQLRALLPSCEVMAMPMAWDSGPEQCLHLQSVVSFVSPDTALVHFQMAPIRLVSALSERGIRLLTLPPEDYDTLGCNVLCTAPGRVVSMAGNTRTAQLLRAEGVVVTEIEAPELMLAGTGGPTCLTFPLARGS